MRKKSFFLATFIILLSGLIQNAFAQGSQVLFLKQGFNFVSFSITPYITPASLLADMGAKCDDIYSYSASAGSFLSAKEGSLATFARGRGYIFKMNSDLNPYLAESAWTAMSPISLKAGYNLVGFSWAPETITFSGLMKKYPVIRTIYKWSNASGTFIQVAKDAAGIPVLSDGIDPAVTAGQAYYLNLENDTTFTIDRTIMSFGSGTVTPPITGTTTASIGTGGGTAAASGISIKVPAGAFAATAQISLAKTDAPVFTDVPVISGTYTLSGLPATRSADVTISLDATSSAIAGDVYLLLKYTDATLRSSLIKGTAADGKLTFVVPRSDQPLSGPATAAPSHDTGAGGVIEAKLTATADWATIDDASGKFSLTYCRSIEKFSGHTELMKTISDIYARAGTDTGLDWTRVKDKIEVVFSPWEFLGDTQRIGVAVQNNSFHPVNVAMYGWHYIALNPNRFRSSADLTVMKATLAHEAFHILTSYNYGAVSFAWTWMDEASATWFERLVISDPTYIPGTVKPNVEDPANSSENWTFMTRGGLETPATAGDYSNAQEQGYGSSMLLTFLTRTYGNSVIKHIYNQRAINNSSIAPCEALKTALSISADTTLSAAWLNFCKSYITGSVYSGVVFPTIAQVLSLDVPNYRAQFTAVTDVPKSYSIAVKDLSARFVTFSVKPSDPATWPAVASVVAMFEWDATLAPDVTVLAYKATSAGAEYFAEIKNGVESEYATNDDSPIKFMIVNRKAVAPYNGSATVNFTARVKDAPVVSDNSYKLRNTYYQYFTNPVATEPYKLLHSNPLSSSIDWTEKLIVDYDGAMNPIYQTKEHYCLSNYTWTSPPASLSAGQSVTFDLKADIMSSDEGVFRNKMHMRFYYDDTSSVNLYRSTSTTEFALAEPTAYSGAAQVYKYSGTGTKSISWNASEIGTRKHIVQIRVETIRIKDSRAFNTRTITFEYSK